jgi:hypothetical protein
MKRFAAGEEIGKVCEKERKFLVKACDRYLAGMGAEPLTFSRSSNVDSVQAITFRECTIASGMGFESGIGKCWPTNGGESAAKRGTANHFVGVGDYTSIWHAV